MIPAASYDHIERILNEETVEIGHGTPEGFPASTKTVGFLIFDQDYARDSIRDLVGNLDMLNLHSGTHMHFFLCGVSKYAPNENEDGGRELGKIGEAHLYHNARAVKTFVDAFEREIPGWRYEVGFDLVLVDVTEVGGRQRLDFSNAVYFKVDEFIRLGIVERPSGLIGKLIKFAREGRLTSAVEFRGELTRLFGVNWLQGLLLAMFPKQVRTLVRGGGVLFGGTAWPE